MEHYPMKAEMNHCLAVDLGGTKILVGEVDEKGKVLRCKKYPSDIRDQKAALDAVIAAITDYKKNAAINFSNISAIGVGIIGRVDADNGVWLQIDPKRTQTLSVAQILSSHFNVPCAIDNDVHCATIAENTFGWGRKSQNYIYMNIGTGIAAGFVVNGKLIRGASFNAGEVGHHVVFHNSDILCDCGRAGCVEAVASGLGLDKRARTLKVKYSDSPLHIPEDSRCDVQEIFTLAEKGDPLCKTLTEDAVDAISETIMNLVRVTDPDTVVLGGGIVADGWMLPKIKAKLHASTMRFVKNGVQLTELDPNNIGLIGAGAIGLYRKH